MNSVPSFFKWVDSTWLNQLVNGSNWLFPAIEAIHIVALAMLLGAILILNLRLLGVVLKGRSLTGLRAELSPWIFSSLIIILLTGVALFATEAVKSYSSGPFRIKMVLLISAIAFHYTVQKFMIRQNQAVRPLWHKAGAALSLVLWFGVGFAGRAIGFF